MLTLDSNFIVALGASRETSGCRTPAELEFLLQTRGHPGAVDGAVHLDMAAVYRKRSLSYPTESTTPRRPWAATGARSPGRI